MIDYSKVKSGKLPAIHDPHTLQLGHYLRSEKLPSPPKSTRYSKKVKNWGSMLNNKIGDCTCAAAGHMIQQWTADASKEIIPPDNAILKAYEELSGYDPKTGKHDTGAPCLKVLKYWRKTGIYKHRIKAFMAIEPNNHAQIRDSVYLFGGCYIGLQLPLTVKTQRVWSVPPGGPVGAGKPGSWALHCVPIVDYDERQLTVVSWGVTLGMTWNFLDTYRDEAYVVLSEDWITPKGIDPKGIDFKTLEADLKAVAR
jgi:hypothetical protein